MYIINYSINFQGAARLFPQGSKTVLQWMHKTNVLDSLSLLDAYKNSYLKYLPKKSPI